MNQRPHRLRSTVRRFAVRRFTAGLLLIASSLGAAAHDFWIEPSTFTPQTGQAVQLRLLVGEKLHGDPVRRPAADGFRQFSIDDGATRRPIGGRTGADPAGLTRVAGAGVQIVVFHGLPIPIELEAEKFNAYLLEEGLEAVVDARKAKGQLGSPGREVYSRNAKSLLRVGGGAAESGGDRALGLPLELVAERNPYGLRPGDELPLRLLHEGKPLAGALVVAQHRQQPALSRWARSDGQGRVSLALGTSGLWLIKAVHMIPAADKAVADWESLWASLTFELPAAP